VSRARDVIEWQDVRVSPTAPPEFPIGRSRSHYYTAAADGRTGPQL
jgi:hypothetical protein